FTHMQVDAGAARHILRRFYREAALAVRGPAPTLILAGLAARHFYFVGDHEGGIKADAELADQAHVFLGVAGQLVDESSGAGPRDRAEVLDELVMAHADTVIADGQRS